MNRCNDYFFRHAAMAMLAACCALCSVPAAAQSEAPAVREFPAAALRGNLVLVSPADITLDGKAERLAPGARIFDDHNRLVMSAQMLNRSLLVNYLRDNLGQVNQVWVLNRDEARLKRPNSARSAFDALFGSSPGSGPRDDGKTPYDQLPAYRN